MSQRPPALGQPCRSLQGLGRQQHAMVRLEKSPLLLNSCHFDSFRLYFGVFVPFTIAPSLL